MMVFFSVLLSVAIFFIGVALFIGIIGFFADWLAEGSIKETWPVKLFAKNYIMYCELQNGMVTIYDKETLHMILPRPTRKAIKDFPTITFAQFKDFYCLNPESWSLKNCRVVKNNDDELSLTFTYPEWKKYQKFKEQVEEEKKQQQERMANQKIEKEKVSTTRKVLEAVQKDIDNIRAEAEKEFEEVKQVVEKASCEHKDVQHVDRRTALNTVLKYDVCRKCGQILKFYKE